ncbi:hypothetical protein [Derxia lacustris]|uniref:hypothetical protein n=1 Tax=Derxia lacustris TaxID=764842 RepID=UPI000A17172C|nr:hypothetical protein [Derxia lacustris]
MTVRQAARERIQLGLLDCTEDEHVAKVRKEQVELLYKLKADYDAFVAGTYERNASDKIFCATDEQLRDRLLFGMQECIRLIRDCDSGR